MGCHDLLGHRNRNVVLDIINGCVPLMIRRLVSDYRDGWDALFLPALARKSYNEG